MNDAVEAARKFDDFIGPLMLWGVNHWELVAVGVVILSLAVALVTRAQQINEREELAKSIAKATRESRS